MTPHRPHYEWRPNYRLVKTFPSINYYDLYIGGEYQHMWVQYDRRTRKFSLHTYDKSLGEFDRFDDAVNHAITMDVIERFEKAYGHNIGI